MTKPIVFSESAAAGAGALINPPITTAMLLAAGLGSRLRPLTDAVPKPLVPVGGEPVLVRTLKNLQRAGLTRVVINTHHHAELVERTVREAQDAQREALGRVEILFSREERPLETGGGVKRALPLLGEAPFLVVNSDAVWCENLAPLVRPLLERFDVVTQDALMAVVSTAQTLGFRSEGDFVLQQAQHGVGPLVRPLDKSTADVVYGGVHVTHPAFIAAHPEEYFSLNAPWNRALTEGRLHGWCYEGPWVDMGSPQGLAAARALVDQTTPR